MFIKKLMAGVFAVAMLSSVAGNVGTVKTQAATYLGYLSQTNFNDYCKSRSYWATTYDFNTYKCKAGNLPDMYPTNHFSISWDEVCRFKHDTGQSFWPWQRAYASWRYCYRN